MAVEKYPDVPNDEVGAIVQSYIDAGVAKVTVSPNADGTTSTVVVKK
jgi:hypothetical protein